MTDAEKLEAIKEDLEEEAQFEGVCTRQRYAKYLLRTFFTKATDEDQLELPFPPNCS